MPKIANKNKGTTGSREVPIIINFLVTLCDKSKFGKTSISGNSKSRTNSGFLKSFLGRYLFVFVKYLRNHSPKIKTKYCILIYATVDFRHWLDDSIDSTPFVDDAKSLLSAVSDASTRVNLSSYIVNGFCRKYAN